MGDSALQNNTIWKLLCVLQTGKLPIYDDVWTSNSYKPVGGTKLIIMRPQFLLVKVFEPLGRATHDEFGLEIYEIQVVTSH